MPTGKDSRLTQVAGIIRGLYPAHPVKAVERALGCSPRQAQRIVETGQVPSAFRGAILQFLQRSAEYNRQRLAELEAEIVKIEQAAQAKAQAATSPAVGGDP